MFNQILSLMGQAIVIACALAFLSFFLNLLLSNLLKVEWFSNSNKHVISAIAATQGTAIVALLGLGYTIPFIIFAVFLLGLATRATGTFLLYKN